MSDDIPRITVLLVDDEENILRALQRLLMDEDFGLESAASGEAALKILETAPNVGVIVSDQRMPGMTGAEFLGRSRELAPHAQRILLTGYSDINATIEAINRGGASRYISKPWNDEELVGIIRDAAQIYERDAEKHRLNDIIGSQNRELEEWNENLKKRLLQSTVTIREQTQALKSLDEKKPATLINAVFDGFLEVVGDRNAVHARTVSTLVTDVARKMNLDSGTVGTFRLAALLHDAGKYGTLSAGLDKHREEMSESEENDYRQHPARGERMFSQIPELPAVLPLIRGHHEAFDGSGFPDGLRGEKIPLGTRLIAIADFIEKSARSVQHRRADYAIMNTRFKAGILFDPALVMKFQPITRIIYFEGKKSGAISEVEVGPMELSPGMIISRDVESGGGILLMQRGTELDAGRIAVIRNHYRKNPPPHGIFVQIVEE